MTNDIAKSLRSLNKQMDIVYVLTKCHEAAEEIERLEIWVNDLQSGMYVNCVYCGHRYGPGETTPVSMADALKAHIEQCSKHPMATLKLQNNLLRDHAKRAEENEDYAIRARDAAEAELAAIKAK